MYHVFGMIPKAGSEKSCDMMLMCVFSWDLSMVYCVIEPRISAPNGVFCRELVKSTCLSPVFVAHHEVLAQAHGRVSFVVVGGGYP